MTGSIIPVPAPDEAVAQQVPLEIGAKSFDEIAAAAGLVAFASADLDAGALLRLSIHVAHGPEGRIYLCPGDVGRLAKHYEGVAKAASVRAAECRRRLGNP
ncbi:MAG TPA: hypothetical protein GYA07_05185 [Verrucomicrobia bacterium]|nr:hypothetical protein [Verrucomicrobiota bacterium]